MRKPARRQGRYAGGLVTAAPSISPSLAIGLAHFGYLMNLRDLNELLSLRDVRNAVVGLSVVFGGIGLSGLTLYASRTGNPWLTVTSAGISLFFVLLILIFIVPPLARNAGREASQLDLPFEVTSGGVVMLGLMAIVGFSAWSTGNNLLFLILSFMIGAMVVGFIAGGICLKKLEVRMRFPETIFAGQETSILVSLTNRKRMFPGYSVAVEVRGHEREESAAAADLRRLLPRFMAEKMAKAPLVRRTLDHFVYIPRGASVEMSVPTVFPQRGRLLIRDFEISTRFPFGFFRHRRRLPARETELYVFPRVDTASAGELDLPAETGRMAALRRGSGQDLLALREYRPDDDLRKVDWKATARSRQLTVREFAAEDERRVTVFLDQRVPETGRKWTLREKLEAENQGKPLLLSERFERGVELAASLVARFIGDQAEVKLVIGGEGGEFGFGQKHLQDCLKRLALADPNIGGRLDGESVLGRLAEISSETPNTYNFVVTTLQRRQLGSEIAENTVVVVF